MMLTAGPYSPGVDWPSPDDPSLPGSWAIVVFAPHLSAEASPLCFGQADPDPKAGLAKLTFPSSSRAFAELQALVVTQAATTLS
jgi:hypothetical protein